MRKGTNKSLPMETWSAFRSGSGMDRKAIWGTMIAVALTCAQRAVRHCSHRRPGIAARDVLAELFSRSRETKLLAFKATVSVRVR